MPEVLPTSDVNRWYYTKRQRTNRSGQFFAERYFDSEREALVYWERRSAELGADRVHTPLRSHESANIWAVCIIPE